MRNKLPRRFLALTLICSAPLLGACGSAGAPSTDSTEGASSGSATPDGNGAPDVRQSLFEGRGVVPVTFKSAFKAGFEASRGNDEIVKNYFPAAVAYEHLAGGELEAAGKVKIRGQRTLGFCGFPKLRFKLSKEVVPSVPLFEGASEINLGTHCADIDEVEQYGKVMNEIAAHRESFAYELFRIIGMPGQRSRPLLATYVDTEAGTSITRMAFAFESIDTLAKRLGGEEAESETGLFSEEESRKLDKKQAARLNLFETLVGNWDWQLYDLQNKNALRPHNIELIRMPDGTLVPIPNDFDLASMVNGKVPKVTPLIFQMVDATRENTLGGISRSLETHKSDPKIAPEDLKEAAVTFMAAKEKVLAELATYPMDEKGRGFIKLRIDVFYEALGEYLASVP